MIELTDEQEQLLAQSDPEASEAPRTSVEIRLDAPETERVVIRELEPGDPDLFAEAREQDRVAKDRLAQAEQRRDAAREHMAVRARGPESSPASWLARDVLDLMGIEWREDHGPDH